MPADEDCGYEFSSMCEEPHDPAGHTGAGYSKPQRSSVKRNKAKTVTCHWCKREGFSWKETEHGWRLHDQDGKLHTCDEYFGDGPDRKGAKIMTTTTIAVPRDVPDGYIPIPTAEQLADALESVRCFHDMSAELIAPELLANLLAALSAQQSAQQSASPEFCCELSYKAAKQKAWNARRIDRCKCDQNEYCDHCWPADFRPGGKWHNGFEAQLEDMG